MGLISPNSSITAGNEYYTAPGSGQRNVRRGVNRGTGVNGTRQYQGYRMVTTTGQTNTLRQSGSGERRDYGNQTLVSRRQQYRIIRTALGLNGG